MHSLNGNTRLNNIKIMHWNKGDSLFTNKLDDLYYSIDKNRPHIISLAEANYYNINDIAIKDYNIEKLEDLGAMSPSI